MKKLILLITVLFFTSNLFALDTPEQTSPANGSTNQNPETSICINHVSGANLYEYQVDTSANFDSPLLAEYSHSSSYYGKTITDLLFDKKYYWRVRADNATDTSAWSCAWNFTTISTITQSSPASGSTEKTPKLSIYVNTKSGIDFYDYQVDTCANFNSPLLAEYSHNDSYSSKTLTNLLFGQKYYWRVRGRHAADTTQWSDAWNFTTLSSITQSSPANGSTEKTPKLSIYVNKKTGVDFYDYQVDTCANFNSPLLAEYSHDDDYSGKTLTDLLFGQKYYWRVRGRHAADTTQWSDAWNFTTLSTITQNSPASGSTGENPELYIYVNKKTGVDFYDYQVDTSANFNSPLLAEYSHDDGYSGKTLTNLLFGQKYYWRVRGRHAADTTQWSYAWNFTTIDYISLTSPSDGSYNWTGVTINWDAITGLTYYDYQVDTSENFNSAVLIEDSNAYINSYSGNSDTQKYLNNLFFGQTYFWRVRGRHDADTTQWSAARTFITKNYVTLVSPSNEQLNINTSGTTLDWDAHPGVSYYMLEFDKTNLFNSADLVQIEEQYISSYNGNSDTRYSTGNLDENTVYFWRVRARNTNDTCSWTTRSFSTGTEPIILPSIPVLLSPINNSEYQLLEVNFDWENSENATGYEFEYSINSDFTNPTSINTESSTTTVSGLDFNVTYYWRVRATDGVNISDWSETWSFTTGLQTPTWISPENEALNQPVDNLYLEWQNITNADNYTIEYSTDVTFNTGVVSQTTANTNISITGLSYDTVYYRRVKAMMGTNQSNWSEVWNFTTEEFLAAPVLTSPTNGSDNQPITLTLDWENVTNATNYNYQYSADNTFATGVISDTITDTQIGISGLEYNTEYFWRVRAVNVSTQSEWSNVWNFTTEVTPLATPVLTSPANGSDNQPITLTLDWQSVTNATNYNYQYSADNTFATGVISDTITDTQIGISGLEYNTEYFWRVRAVNVSTQSEWSNVWNFTTEVTPLATPVLTSPANGSDNQPITLTLDWQSVTNATSYNYQYSADNTFATGVIDDTITDTQIDISGLEYNTEYFWRVRAINASTQSDWSNVWNFTTEVTPLATPVLTSPANGSDNQPITLTLDWENVTNATSYNYQYSADNTFATGVISDTITDTQIGISGLEYNTEYFWRVRAVNVSTQSKWSGVWSFKTKKFDNIFDYSHNILINIYPNPNDGNFQLQVSDLKNAYNIKIFDLSGKSVYQQNNCTKQLLTINLNKLDKGIYLVKIETMNKILTKKIIIN